MAKTDGSLTQAHNQVVSQQESLDRIVKGIKRYHNLGRFGTGHPGAFEYCLEEPCISVLRAYPDAVPADRRPDWIEGSDSLARHH